MEHQNILNLQNRYEFRSRLMLNSDTENECRLKLKRGKPVSEDVFYYIGAVEEALCFGRIDSTQKEINGVGMQRFTPRKKNSPWTELNKERVRRLKKPGPMTDRGRRVLPDMGARSFKIDKDLETALREARVWSRFVKFPPLYRRIRAYDIEFYKNRNREAYERALKHLIAETRLGRMYGEWNDYGRLIDY